MQKTNRVQGLLTIFIIVTAGCLGSAGSITSGSLTIDNNDNVTHSVDISVQKVTNNSNDAPPRSDTTTTPPASVVWEKQYTIELSAGESVERPDFITEGGTYYLQVHVDGMETKSIWHGFSGLVDDMGVTGGYVSVDINNREVMIDIIYDG